MGSPAFSMMGFGGRLRLQEADTPVVNDAPLPGMFFAIMYHPPGLLLASCEVVALYTVLAARPSMSD
jgi:hypothetical protein